MAKKKITPPSLGEGLRFDPGVLADTRMLVQANSGGGKSWLLRRLCEQSAPHIPFIVLDYEGSLRPYGRN